MREAVPGRPSRCATTSREPTRPSCCAPGLRLRPVLVRFDVRGPPESPVGPPKGRRPALESRVCLIERQFAPRAGRFCPCDTLRGRNESLARYREVEIRYPEGQIWYSASLFWYSESKIGYSNRPRGYNESPAGYSLSQIGYSDTPIWYSAIRVNKDVARSGG